MVGRNRAVAVIFAVFVAQDQLEILDRRQSQRGADDQRAVLAEIVVAVELVGEIAIVLVIEHGELGLDLVLDDRPGDGAAQSHLRPGRHLRAHIGMEGVAGRGGTEHHCATGHVAPEQQALRTAQHLQPLKVEIAEDDARADAQIHAVHEHADGWVDRGDRTVDAETPNGEVGIARRRADLRQRHVGDVVAQALQRLKILFVQLRRAERGDGEGHVLDVLRFAAFGGGDHDVSQTVGRLVAERALFLHGGFGFLRRAGLCGLRCRCLLRHRGNRRDDPGHARPEQQHRLQCARTLHIILPSLRVDARRSACAAGRCCQRRAGLLRSPGPNKRPRRTLYQSRAAWPSRKSRCRFSQRALPALAHSGKKRASSEAG